MPPRPGCSGVIKLRKPRSRAAADVAGPMQAAGRSSASLARAALAKEIDRRRAGEGERVNLALSDQRRQIHPACRHDRSIRDDRPYACAARLQDLPG